MFFERVQGNDIYGTDVNPPNAYQPQVSSIYFSNPNTSNLTGQTATAPYFPGQFASLAYNQYASPATAQFSLGVQRELAPSTVALIQYVGMTAWHQNIQLAANTLPIGDVTDRQKVAGGTNANLYRIYQGFAGVNRVANTTNSSYNSLQASLRMENRHRLNLRLGYTYSHEIDISSGDLNSTGLAGSGGGLSNPFDVSYDRGSGTIDRRHVFNANFIYSFPSFDSSGAMMRLVAGGWQLSGVTAATSGNPVNVTYSPDVHSAGSLV